MSKKADSDAAARQLLASQVRVVVLVDAIVDLRPGDLLAVMDPNRGPKQRQGALPDEQLAQELWQRLEYVYAHIDTLCSYMPLPKRLKEP
jgi:hypothetical protein